MMKSQNLFNDMKKPEKIQEYNMIPKSPSNLNTVLNKKARKLIEGYSSK